MQSAPQNPHEILRLWNEAWTCLKLPVSVTLIRTVGALSSVLAATIAIFIDVEGIKSEATIGGRIRLKELAQKAWTDRFVRRVFLFILLANSIYLFGDYLKDRATDDSNDATSRLIVGRTQSATDNAMVEIEKAVTGESQKSERQIVGHVTEKTDQINRKQEQVARNAGNALDAIRDSQYAFYDTRIELVRSWRDDEGEPYPKICQFLEDQRAKDQSNISTTDPGVAPLAAGNADYGRDPLIISDLKKLEFEAYIYIRQHTSYSKATIVDDMPFLSFSSPELEASTHTKGAFALGSDSNPEIYFTYFHNLPNGVPNSWCEEHMSIFDDADPKLFPDRSIPQLAGKILSIGFLSIVHPATTDKYGRTTPWKVEGVYFGDFGLRLTDEDPDMFAQFSGEGKRVTAAYLRQVFNDLEGQQIDGTQYEIEFPTEWKDLAAIFDYRPYKR